MVEGPRRFRAEQVGVCELGQRNRIFSLVTLQLALVVHLAHLSMAKLVSDLSEKLEKAEEVNFNY